MIDQLLYSAVLVAPELGSAANSAFKNWAGGIAREMAAQAVQEAIGQTKSALPFFLQSGINAVAGDLKPKIEKMAASTAESVLGKSLAGHAIVPVALYEAQQAVIEAVRKGGDVSSALAALDTFQHPASQAKTA